MRKRISVPLETFPAVDFPQKIRYILGAQLLVYRRKAIGVTEDGYDRIIWYNSIVGAVLPAFFEVRLWKAGRTFVRDLWCGHES